MAYNKAFGDCEGPLGFPMKSDTAKLIDRLLAGTMVEVEGSGSVVLSEDCRKLMRATKVADITFKENERADISLITTDALDRDMEVMYPQGGNFAQFRKNPIVTWAHQYDELPVGRALWLKREKGDKRNGWLAKTRYTSKPADWEHAWFPDAVWHFIRSGDLPGKSIGFIPLEIRGPNDDELKVRPELVKVRGIISKWLALEYAVAPVQSNPDALVEHVAKAKSVGLDTHKLLADLGFVITGKANDDEKSKPLPKPNQGESEGDFISRCMANPTMNREYPDNEQRAGVCHSQWDRSKTALAEALDPKSVVSSTAIRKAVANTLKEALADLDIAGAVRNAIDRTKGRV